MVGTRHPTLMASFPGSHALLEMDSRGLRNQAMKHGPLASLPGPIPEIDPALSVTCMMNTWCPGKRSGKEKHLNEIALNVEGAGEGITWLCLLASSGALEPQFPLLYMCGDPEAWPAGPAVSSSG